MERCLVVYPYSFCPLPEIGVAPPRIPYRSGSGRSPFTVRLLCRIEQIECASVRRVVIFGRLQIIVQWYCECNPFCINTGVNVYLRLKGLDTPL